MTTLTQVIQPIPYLNFPGNCSEAIEFYSKALKARLTSKTRLGDMPMCGGDGGDSEGNQFRSENPDMIMNAQLELPGGGKLYLGDCPSFMPYSKVAGLNLTLNYPTIEEGEEIFRALAEGGSISMDWSPTFWAEKFGMVTDKFGVPWLINGNLR